MAKHWGFDVRDMDMSVRPQDDFYNYAIGGWRKRNPIPASESRWGTFMKLRYQVDRQLRTILDQLLTAKRAAPGSPEQMVRDFYRSGMDMKQRNAGDLAPLVPYLKEIESAKTPEALETIIAKLARIGVDTPFGVYIDQDDKNSEQYILRFTQAGLGLPERDYYLNDDAESLRVRSAYEAHLRKLYALMGDALAAAKSKASAHLALETELARASMKKEDRRDPHKMYNKMTLAKLQELAPGFDWVLYVKRIGAGEPKDVIVSQPKFMTVAARLIRETPPPVLKHYLAWHLVNDYAGSLSERFIRASFAFYGKVLTGAKSMRPLWRRSLNAVNAELGEVLGRIYVKKHFPPAAKKKMEMLVDDLFEAYEKRIQKLEWMSSSTKKKALVKLRALNRKIGYPDRWRSYRGLVIRADDFAGNMLRATEFEARRQLKKLGKPVDRAEWHMYPQTVNAYFAPNMNDIVFPAGILQPPYFDMHADDAVNYGATGMTIGHEITHGFDDEGSKFDAKGNLKSWWTPEDRARFEKRAEVLRKQFDRYEVAGGIKVNGKLTLGENIADLGGVAIALDAYRLRAEKNAKPNLDGLTPTQRFFLGFAVFEAENIRPELEKMFVLTNPHSPGKFRINGPASNLPEFYEAFGVKKGDQLYRNPKSRADIW